MKKFLTLLLTALLLFSLVSCRAKPTAENDAEEGEALEEEVVNDAKNPNWVIYRIIPADPALYVRPEKKTFSSGDQELLNTYYLQMIKQRPAFAAVPREMLYESITHPQYGSSIVEFIFCIGGIRTFCSCHRYSNSDPWSCSHENLLAFATIGFTEAQMNKIRALLAQQTEDYIDQHHLEKTENLAENLHIYWECQDGRLFASSEHIAHVTPETQGSFGCGDHAHVMAKVYIEYR